MRIGRNDSKCTIGKYHINTVEIIKLFRVNILFWPVTKFPRLTILLFFKRSPFWIYDQFKDFSNKLTAKIWDFTLRKKGREKARMVKVAKSCHQVTWAMGTKKT